MSCLRKDSGRFRVTTPFKFGDGDHLELLLKRRQEGWTLSDEGSTYMRLTHGLDESDLHEGNRAGIIANALSQFQVADQEWELQITIPDESFGAALYNLVQAILKISDVTYLSREIVRSTFLEDFRGVLASTVKDESRRHFDWHDPILDPEGHYAVDCRIDDTDRPLFVFALSNEIRVRDATIKLHQYENWTVPCRSLGIFENEEEIDRGVLARFGDVAGKLFSNLSQGNRPRIRKYLEDELGPFNPPGRIATLEDD